MKRHHSYFVIIADNSDTPFFSGILDSYDYDKRDAWQREPLNITFLNDLDVAIQWKTALQRGFPNVNLSIRPVTLDIKDLPRL